MGCEWFNLISVSKYAPHPSIGLYCCIRSTKKCRRINFNRVTVNGLIRSRGRRKNVSNQQDNVPDSVNKGHVSHSRTLSNTNHRRAQSIFALLWGDERNRAKLNHGRPHYYCLSQMMRKEIDSQMKLAECSRPPRKALHQIVINSQDDYNSFIIWQIKLSPQVGKYSPWCRTRHQHTCADLYSTREHFHLGDTITVLPSLLFIINAATCSIGLHISSIRASEVENR